VHSKHPCHVQAPGAPMLCAFATPVKCGHLAFYPTLETICEREQCRLGWPCRWRTLAPVDRLVPLINIQRLLAPRELEFRSFLSCVPLQCNPEYSVRPSPILILINPLLFHITARVLPPPPVLPYSKTESHHYASLTSILTRS
jgi:hypothetical protein